MLALGCSNRDVIIWSISDWNEAARFTDGKGARSFSWSNDYRFLAIGSFFYSDKPPYMNIRYTKDWSLVDNSLYRSSYIAFSPDCKFLAYQFKMEGIKITCLSNFEEITLLDFSDSKKHVDISSPTWSPDGKYIAASCDDGRIHIWRTSDWSVVKTFKLHGFWDEAKYQVAFSPDNRFLVSCGYGTPKLISTSNWREIHEFEDIKTSDYLDFTWSKKSHSLAIVQTPYAPIEVFGIV